MHTPSKDRLRVLIVDDDVDAVHMLCCLLDLIGYEVHGVANPRQAVTRAREVRPHVALLDISMPEVDGYTLARQLRQVPELKDLQMVAYTGRVTPADRERTRAAGFDHHLAKPAALADVIEVIETLSLKSSRDGQRDHSGDRTGHEDRV
jgi:CheY-like chemotaxis protein